MAPVLRWLSIVVILMGLLVIVYWGRELVKVKCILGMSPVSISNPHTGMDTSSTA